MDDPDSLAALEVLAEVLSAATFTDQNLSHSRHLPNGQSQPASEATPTRRASPMSCLASLPGPRFGDYKAGFRFGRLGYELVAQRGMRRFQTRVEMCFGVLRHSLDETCPAWP